MFASPAADVWQLAIDPSDSNTIHATTSQGMMRSSDGGLSWFSRLPQPTSQSHLTISPADAKTVYVDARTESGVAIYRSVDRGEAWSLRSVPPPSIIRALIADPLDPGVVYLSTDSLGIFRSGDGGVSWQPINEGLPTTFTSSIAISAHGPVLHATMSGMWETSLRSRKRAAR